MQRLFRPATAFKAARGVAQTQIRGQAVTIQRVKLSRQKNLFRSLLIGGGVTFICWHVYTSTVISPLLKHLDKEIEALSPNERKELEEEMDEADNSMFIAFPFTTKQINSMPYQGTDPEWQQFGEISKDKNLQDQIRNDLADIVKRSVERHPLVIHRCGRVVRLRRYWLDIDFPYRPPPTFEHSGLLFDDDGIYWASEPVDSMTVFRLRKILWPSAMAQSSWAFSAAMAKQHWGEFTKALGFQSPPASQTPSRPQKDALEQSKLPSPGRQTPDGTPAEGPDSAVNKSADARQPRESARGGKTNFLKDAAMTRVDGVRDMSSGPWLEFQKKLALTWKSTKDYPPRGSIVVSGFVEIETQKGFVVVDVWSHWNPKLKKFDSASMWMNVRRIQMKVQTPARR